MTGKQDMLNQIADQLDNLPDFGSIQIFIKSHYGAGKADIVKMTTTKYTDNEPNVSLTADIIRMIKLIDATGSSGTLGFSVNFEAGSAKTLQLQDFHKM